MILPRTNEIKKKLSTQYGRVKQQLRIYMLFTNTCIACFNKIEAKITHKSKTQAVPTKKALLLKLSKLNLHFMSEVSLKSASSNFFGRQTNV